MTFDLNSTLNANPYGLSLYHHTERRHLQSITMQCVPPAAGSGRSV
jgi:hypothetical protein